MTREGNSRNLFTTADGFSGLETAQRGSFRETTIYANGNEVRTYLYPAIEPRFSSPMVNDDNLHFCGGWSITEVDEGGVHHELNNDDLYFRRTLEGLKPMAEIVGPSITGWSDDEELKERERQVAAARVQELAAEARG